MYVQVLFENVAGDDLTLPATLASPSSTSLRSKKGLAADIERGLISFGSDSLEHGPSPYEHMHEEAIAKKTQVQASTRVLIIIWISRRLQFSTPIHESIGEEVFATSYRVL